MLISLQSLRCWSPVVGPFRGWRNQPQASQWPNKCPTKTPSWVWKLGTPKSHIIEPHFPY
jgi:hypothetical protein